MYLQQGTDVSSTEDIPERIKHLSIDDSYMTDWRSETTSTTSSDSGKGGFDGNKPLQLLNAFQEECGTRKIESRQIEWSTCATRTKRKYIQQTTIPAKSLWPPSEESPPPLPLFQCCYNDVDFSFDISGRGYGGKGSHCPMLLSEIVATSLLQY